MGSIVSIFKDTSTYSVFYVVFQYVSDTSKVICIAYILSALHFIDFSLWLYPIHRRPLLYSHKIHNLYYSEFDDSEAQVVEYNNRYDIIVHRRVNHSEIPPETVFGCVLRIPGTDYEIREESIYKHRHGKRKKNFSTSSQLSMLHKHEMICRGRKGKHQKKASFDLQSCF